MDPVFKKLNYKDQQQLFIVNAPKSFDNNLKEMTSLAVIKTSLTGAKRVEFFLAFVIKQKELDDLTKKITVIAEDDAVLWFAYPKGTSKKYTCEFNRDNGWNELGKAGYEPVRMVAIDEDWSALRFRKTEKIKKMIRRSALSESGKKRIARKSASGKVKK